MTIFYLIILGILGASIGSFVNVVLFRLPRHGNPCNGRSACPHCKHILSWRDLFPIISFVLLRAKCRYCKADISWRYPAVEATMALLFIFGGIFVGPGLFLAADWMKLIIYLVAVTFFVILFIYDLEHYLVLDKISLPCFGIILILNLVLGILLKFPFVQYAEYLLLGALVGAGWFLWQWLVSRGAWVGGGDIRIGLLVGALVGWPKILLVLMIAYIGGSIIALILIALRQKTFKSRLPFATLLLPSALIVWLWGEGIWMWYLGILGFGG